MCDLKLRDSDTAGFLEVMRILIPVFNCFSKDLVTNFEYYSLFKVSANLL
jgi:hypothetical protein